MKKHVLILIIVFIIISFFLVNSTALAGSFYEGLKQAGTQAQMTLQPLSAYAAGLVKGLLTLIGVVFLGLLIYGGFLYLTAAGNEEKVEQGRNTLTAAVIGLIIIMTGYSITYFITLRLETPGGGIPPQNPECENESHNNYYSINCCEYRFQVYDGRVDETCCSQTTFYNSHQAECDNWGYGG